MFPPHLYVNKSQTERRLAVSSLVLEATRGDQASEVVTHGGHLPAEEKVGWGAGGKRVQGGSEGRVEETEDRLCVC